MWVLSNYMDCHPPIQLKPNVSELIVKSSKTYFSFTGIDIFLRRGRLADGSVPFCQDARWEPQFEQDRDEDVS